MRNIVYMILLLITVCNSLHGQENQDTSSSRIEIIQSESSIIMIGGGLDSLRGNVIIKHDSTYMYCDTAIMRDDRTHITAFGEVSIVMSDTLSMFCDSLVYSSQTKNANMYGHVILENGEENLRTQRLDYDLQTEKATFNSETTLSKGSTIVRSKNGTYASNQNKAFFYDQVEVIDSNFMLKTDTLIYSRNNNQADFRGPTRVQQKDAQIYCESGYYNLSEDYAKFENNAQYVQDSIIATANSIFYDSKKDEVQLEGDARIVSEGSVAEAMQITYNEATEVMYLTGNAIVNDGTKEMTSDFITYDKANNVIETEGFAEVADSSSYLKADNLSYSDTGESIAKGNIEYIDKESKLTILSDHMIENEESETTTVYGDILKPQMILQIDTSFLYIVADTFHLASDTSGQQQLFAYQNVSILGEDFQAICDSLSYHAADSTFVLYQGPIAYTDDSQFSGDTIFLEMKHHRIDRVDIHHNAMIIVENEADVFDQIKGRIVNTYFRESEVDSMQVRGSSESIYFVSDDDDAYIGVNKSICSDMDISFDDGEIEELIFLDDPTSELTPMDKIGKGDIRLPGFNWDQSQRPKDANVIRQR